MTPAHLRAVLPLLLLVGAAVPAQADVTASVECPDCSVLSRNAFLLVVDEPLAQAMAMDAECESAVFAVARQAVVQTSATGMPGCLDGTTLYSIQFKGWDFVTAGNSFSGSELNARTGSAKADGSGTGSDGGPCSGVVLGNFNPEDPVGSISNSFSYNLRDCIPTLVFL